MTVMSAVQWSGRNINRTPTALYSVALCHNTVCAVVTVRKRVRLNDLQVNVLLWRECLITANELYCI